MNGRPQLSADGVAARTDKPVSLLGVLTELAALMPRLLEVIEHQPRSAPPAVPLDGRLTLRLDELAHALGVSRRVLERERASGRLLPPDLTIGRMPLYRIESVRAWLASGGGKGVA
jgi:hypothetical protein